MIRRPFAAQSEQLLSVEEHLTDCLALVASAAPAAVETVPLAAADDRVLAEPVRAPIALPGFDNSAMDGYAVHPDDVAAATPTDPVRLRVVGDVPAGSYRESSFGVGEAVRIMTGAALPPARSGPLAVVQVEHTDAGSETVAIHHPATAGQNVRHAGEDVTVDEQVLSAGQRLSPPRIALLASLGFDAVAVVRRPRVLVLATGSELVEPGEPLGPGQIHESNAHLLAAAVRAAGGEPVRAHVGDDPAELRALLDRLLPRVDLVLTSGGVSAGAYEPVKEALAADLRFRKVLMQPGMPQGCGHLGTPDGRRVPVLALPGNPVSTSVSFEVFARPVLARLQALSAEAPLRPELPAVAAGSWASPAGKQQFARVRLDWTVDGPRAHPIGGQRSHLVADLAASNALAVVPPDARQVDVGDVVWCWLLT